MGLHSAKSDEKTERFSFKTPLKTDLNEVLNRKQIAAKQERISNKNLQRLAVITAAITAFLLAVIKFIAGIYSGSVSVLSSAIDSMLDLLVSALNFFALRKSQAGPNEKFNFGYTKLEALTAMFEGVLIVGIGGFIFYESILKFRADEIDINVDLSLYVMIFSFAVTGALVAFLNFVAKKTQNLIIKADALHYKSDFFTNLGIIAALLIIKFSGFTVIDAVFGIIISGYIVNSAVSLMKESLGVLLDKALEPEMVSQIKAVIESKKEISSFHGLMTRKSSDICYMVVHLVFDKEILLITAHEISNQIEHEIKSKFSEFRWEITTHLDPYDDRNSA